ncbi:unnamed protein product, partial [Amoebophrya sp. A25]
GVRPSGAGRGAGPVRILACNFSDDGSKLAAYATDASVTVWSLQSAGFLDYFRKDSGRAAALHTGYAEHFR